jgi:hypothetical protein
MTSLFLAGFFLEIAFAAIPAPPPAPAAPPSIRDRADPSEVGPAIFTYRIDQRCQVDDTRKLQGADDLLWNDVARARSIDDENTVWRFVDNVRTQLFERRVRLLGEMVRGGELICHVRPSGEVVAAWIERRDTSTARRRAPIRESVDIRGGRLPDLGTFSVTFDTASVETDS